MEQRERRTALMVVGAGGTFRRRCVAPFIPTSLFNQGSETVCLASRHQTDIHLAAHLFHPS